MSPNAEFRFAGRFRACHLSVPKREALLAHAASATDSWTVSLAPCATMQRAKMREGATNLDGKQPRQDQE